ncbi:hypothetical protein OY671_007552, partial [Metschnikowia pulcherrima]
KASTAAALATSVDAGKIGWDDKVIDHIPDFQMFDAWVTREMTIRDLSVHRSGSGSGAGDSLTVPRGAISRDDSMRRSRYLQPATSFRSGYAYDNILYGVAGSSIERVSGQSWEDYMKAHVFAPAGMRDAAADFRTQTFAPNRAQPHGRVGMVRGDGPQVVLDERDQSGRAMAPAGSIAMSANDMARWRPPVQRGGRQGDVSPVTPIPITPAPEPIAATTPTFDAYASGWEVRDYHGTRIVWHAGGSLGFTSIVCSIPEKNVGFAIEVNAEESEPRHGSMYESLDHYSGSPRQDWPQRFHDYRAKRIVDAVAAMKQAATTPAQVGPSSPLDRYAGTYSDPWYGKSAIGSDAKGSTVSFVPTAGMSGRLVHYQYDTFIAQFDDPGIEKAYLTFQLDADGKVSSISAKPVSPIADFSFDYKDSSFTPAPEPRK